MKNIKFVIVTGFSGAGKTQASRCFEDLGFFCVDNLPPVLMPEFAQLVAKSEGNIRKVALVIDAREGDFLGSLSFALEQLKAMGFLYKIIFLEANPKVLIRRFKEARLQHPLSPSGTISQGIKMEGKRLEEIRSQADYILDTSDFTPWDLKRRISSLFLEGGENGISINVLSFGYKFGVPADADFVFDVRFLPNPNYIADLQHLSGQDKPAKDFVLSNKVSMEYLRRLVDFIEFLIPYNAEEGKGVLNLAVGCTGGRHRSVVVADEIARHLKKNYPVHVLHRDVHKKA